MKDIIIIGAGLSGAEAAWQAANMGAKVTLYEMRPVKSTPAHKTAEFAELVCSNSLRGAGMENAVGVLKEEMRRLNSIIMEAADTTKVPAGGALAVDRHGFSQYITDKVSSHPNITVIHEENHDRTKWIEDTSFNSVFNHFFSKLFINKTNGAHIIIENTDFHSLCGFFK